MTQYFLTDEKEVDICMVGAASVPWAIVLSARC